LRSTHAPQIAAFDDESAVVSFGDYVRLMANNPRPAEPARPSWLPAHLFPFESRFLDVNGARVHYVDEGDGSPLLLLHGNPTFSFLYRDIITGLRERFRCIAVDHPGFGLSSAPAGYGFTPAEHAGVLEKVVQRLDLTGQPFLFFGHAADRRGRLLYRRTDGHYGLIRPATAGR